MNEEENSFSYQDLNFFVNERPSKRKLWTKEFRTLYEKSETKANNYIDFLS